MLMTNKRKYDFICQTRLKPIKKRNVNVLYQNRSKKLESSPILPSIEDIQKALSENQIMQEDSESKEKKKIERELNHIYFYSEVTRESIYDLIALIREAQEECYLTQLKMNILEVPIYLHISSYGGSIFAAFSAIDVIQSSKIPIYTIIDGASASAGTLMSVVGKKRFIRKTSYMLIHQLSSSCWGKYAEIQDEYKNLKDLTKKIIEIYTNHTTFPKNQLKRILKHDLWLDSNKCIEYGLVDELWND
jgi:ATP-dependent Clp endopeptidase proteolytic subunit ClpP